MDMFFVMLSVVIWCSPIFYLAYDPRILNKYISKVTDLIGRRVILAALLVLWIILYFWLFVIVSGYFLTT